MAQTSIVRWLICGLAISLPLPILPGTALAHGEWAASITKRKPFAAQPTGPTL